MKYLQGKDIFEADKGAGSQKAREFLFGRGKIHVVSEPMKEREGKSGLVRIDFPGMKIND